MQRFDTLLNRFEALLNRFEGADGSAAPMLEEAKGLAQAAAEAAPEAITPSRLPSEVKALDKQVFAHFPALHEAAKASGEAHLDALSSVAEEGFQLARSIVLALATSKRQPAADLAPVVAPAL